MTKHSFDFIYTSVSLYGATLKIVLRNNYGRLFSDSDRNHAFKDTESDWHSCPKF